MTVSRRNVEDIYPLTPLQEGMLFHGQLAPGTGAYVEQWPLLVEGACDAERYARAFQRAVDRHPALRTAFVSEPKPMQVVMRRAAVPVERLDWSGADEASWRARLDGLLAEGRRRGFDLTRAPLIRLTLVRLSPSRQLVVIAIHHAIVDGWSLPLVLGDADVFYRAEADGTEPAPPPAPRFRDYVAWLRRQDPAIAEGHWRRALAGFAAPTPLPFDRAGMGGGEQSSARVRLDAERMALVRAFLRREALTPGTLVLGAWALLLARFSGHDDVLFGTTVSGRPPDLVRVEEMVGVFINTVPVRVRVAPGSRVAPWLAALQHEQAEGRQHGHAPLVEVHGWSGVPRGQPLFESLAVFENYPQGPAEVDDEGPRIEPLPVPERTSYPLTLIAVPGQDALELRLSWHEGRIGGGDARRLLDALATLVVGLAENGERTLSAVPSFAPGERERIVAEWNRTAVPYPRDETVHALFAAVAAERPDAVALEWSSGTVTYGELEARANRIAHHLRSLGIGPESPVAVPVERDPDSFVAILAVLKAGGAYLALDPTHPAERLAGMIAGAKARALVVAGVVPRSLASFAGPVVSLAEDAARIAAHPPRAPESGASACGLAYVVHTSGSTGRPKGVAVPHRAVVRLVRGTGYHSFAAGDRIGQISSPSFDALTFEVWGALLNGGTLVGMERDTVLDPPALARTLGARRITAAFLSSAVFSRAAREAAGAFAGMRTLLVGGEAVEAAAVRAVLEAGGPERLVNGYGPSENTTFSTADLIQRVPAAGEALPIGRPIANTTAYVLDPLLRPLPAGAWGELALGGDGVARGYVGQPAATAARFVPDPFGAPGSRLYRSGDRARWRADGTLDFGGRTDLQVKIRGIRIEPGEVEAALRALPGIADAAVAARDDDAGERRLVAYLVSATEAAPAPEAIREGLARTLPEAMIPSAFVALDHLPLTTSGKVDRAALPAPEGRSGSAAAGPPESSAERLLARLWTEVLGVEGVGAGDHFFALGGHSLLATRLVSAVRAEAGIELPLRVVFEAPTLRDLAKRLEALAPELADGEVAALLESLSLEELEVLLEGGARP